MAFQGTSFIAFLGTSFIAFLGINLWEQVTWFLVLIIIIIFMAKYQMMNSCLFTLYLSTLIASKFFWKNSLLFWSHVYIVVITLVTHLVQQLVLSVLSCTTFLAHLSYRMPFKLCNLALTCYIAIFIIPPFILAYEDCYSF